MSLKDTKFDTLNSVAFTSFLKDCVELVIDEMIDIVVACTTLGAWVCGLWLFPKCAQCCQGGGSSENNETIQMSSVVIEETSAFLTKTDSAQAVPVDNVFYDDTSPKHFDKHTSHLPHARLIAGNGYPLKF